MAANSGENLLGNNSPTFRSIVAQAQVWMTEEDQGSWCDVKVTNVYDNRYRVNFYRKHYPGENKVVPDFKICASYFCHYDNGILTDKTKYVPSPLND